MRFVSGVDLPVPVQTAGVGQQLPALLALDAWLSIGSDLPGLDPTERMFVRLEPGELVLVLTGVVPVVARGRNVGQQLAAESVRQSKVGEGVILLGLLVFMGKVVNNKISVLAIITRLSPA